MKEFYFWLCDISGFLCLIVIPFVLFVFFRNRCENRYGGLNVSGDNYDVAVSVANGLIYENKSKINVTKDEYNYRLKKLRQLEFEARRWGCAELKNLVLRLRETYKSLEIVWAL